MADMPTRTSVPLSKRKSILGDLGIKTGGHPSKTPAVRATATKTPGTKPAAPKASTAKPLASNGNTLSPGPGLKRANTVGSAPTTRATTTPRPRPLSSIHNKSPSSSTNPSPPTVQKSSSTLSRTSNSSSGSASSKPGRKTPSNILPSGSPGRSSPKSPTTPLPKRRSVVPLGPNSPLAQRSSVAVGAPSHNVTKRMSTSSLDSLAEVKALKETLTHREELLEEKDKQLQDLRGRLEQLEKEYSERLDQEPPMLSSSSHLIPCDVSIDSEHATLDVKEDKAVSALGDDIIKMHGQQVSILKEQLATAEKDNEQLKRAINEEKERSIGEKTLKAKQELAEKRLEEKEKIHQEILASIRLDHKKTIENLKGEHERQLSLLRSSHQEKERNTTDMLRQDKEALLASSQESYQTETAKLKERIAELESIVEESKSVANLRKLEKQLSDHNIIFEEYKRQSEQATEALERRFRDEMQQLQNGSDDTAQAWLEKNRAAQQEIDRLHIIFHELGVTHQNDIVELEAIHEKHLEEAKTKSDAQEAELDGQAHQIESLLFQVETLQTALEGATSRLEEHTVKLKNKDSEESLNGIYPSHRENIHRLCEEKLQTRQRDLDELHGRISELKEMHDAQLNRLGHEKAKELQELQRELAGLKEKHQAYSTNSEERIQAIAHQHTKEIGVMQSQYQRLVDIKDRELEDYAYRVRALSASRQKELDQFREESTEKITRLEYEIEGYESRVKEFERQTQEMKKSLHQWENQGNADQNVIDKLKHDCSAHRDENDQLITLLNQLQSELHKGRA